MRRPEQTNKLNQERSPSKEFNGLSSTAATLIRNEVTQYFRKSAKDDSQYKNNHDGFEIRTNRLLLDTRKVANIGPGG